MKRRCQKVSLHRPCSWKEVQDVQFLLPKLQGTNLNMSLSAQFATFTPSQVFFFFFLPLSRSFIFEKKKKNCLVSWQEQDFVAKGKSKLQDFTVSPPNTCCHHCSIQEHRRWQTQTPSNSKTPCALCVAVWRPHTPAAGNSIWIPPPRALSDSITDMCMCLLHW